MFARRIVCTSVVVVLLSLSISGCGQTGGSATVVPASGTITMDGQPLDGASVTFLPAVTTTGQGGTGSTDASGKYEVTHFREGKGVEPGQYRVVVSKLVMQDGSPIPAGTSAADVVTKDVVPPQYSDYNATTLTATVEAGGKPIDFALKSR